MWGPRCCVLFALCGVSTIQELQGQAEDTGANDCLEGLFLRAGVRDSQVVRYASAFRSNGLGDEVLFDLSFVELVTLLEGRSFNITHAGDVFAIHKCVTERGPCLTQPYCLHGGTCVYDEHLLAHVCECATFYTGDRCETRVKDRLGILEETVNGHVKIFQVMGTSYTRWGKSSCNATAGAELVYDGYVAGQYYTHSGGASNYLCLPFDPEYGQHRPGDQAHGLIYGAEFETHGYFEPYGSLAEHNPTCAVCHLLGRTSQIMVPGRKSCPVNWTREYHGYLMTAHHGHKARTEYICVDRHPDVVRGEAGDSNGALLYFVQAQCGYGLDCPPYNNDKEITCAVCTR